MSIWATVEAEAWSRGLRYEDYLNLHTRNNTNALTEKGYRLVCEAFDADLEWETNHAEI